MILSLALRSLYALVSHLCLTGLPEVAMPYNIPAHQAIMLTPSRAVARSTPRRYMETSTRSTTYQMDRPPPPR